MTEITLTQQDREALDKIREAITENDGTGTTARWRAPLGTIPTDSNEFHHLMENGLIFLDRGIGVTIRSRYMLLDEVVAALSTEFGFDPIYKCYEAGGHVAYGIWARAGEYTGVVLGEKRDECEIQRYVLSNRRVVEQPTESFTEDYGHGGDEEDIENVVVWDDTDASVIILREGEQFVAYTYTITE